MVEGFNPIRYSVIEDKNPREIVMLVGDGCKWRKCRFCDYHLDSSKDIEANFQLNKQVLSNVTGKFGELEVINSGSFNNGQSIWNGYDIGKRFICVDIPYNRHCK